MAAAKNALLRAVRCFSSTPPFHPMMPVQIWWDIDTFLPEKGYVKAQIEELTRGLRRLDFQGLVNVEAFGNTELLCAETRRELADAVKVVNHVPGGEDALIHEVTQARFMKFCLENPPPACHFLLSSNASVMPLLDVFKELGYTAMHGVRSQALALNGRPPF